MSSSSWCRAARRRRAWRAAPRVPPAAQQHRRPVLRRRRSSSWNSAFQPANTRTIWPLKISSRGRRWPSVRPNNSSSGSVRMWFRPGPEPDEGAGGAKSSAYGRRKHATHSGGGPPTHPDPIPVRVWRHWPCQRAKSLVCTDALHVRLRDTLRSPVRGTFSTVTNQ